MGSQHFLIPRHQITFPNNALIGEGSFGKVLQGHWSTNNRSVAVKILKDASDQYGFWAEIVKMQRLNHANILKLVGICPPRNQNESPWIITELMLTDLLQHILNTPFATADIMVKWAYGVASGMAYMHHSVNPPTMHKDLACRNILIDGNNNVKIGDFGKFDEHYETGHYYNVRDYCQHDEEDDDCECIPFPLRWMPPENLPDFSDSSPKPLFSFEGDIWAYGVVLFEIWTKGRIPYDGMDDSEVQDALRSGQNPRDFDQVSARGYILEIMNDCWNWYPDERPDFEKIKEDLERGGDL